MNVPLPPQLIALLPLVLDFGERLLDRSGILGFSYVVKRVAGDGREAFRAMFLKDGAANARLDSIAAYFEFEDRASDVIKSHITFLLSLFITTIVKSRDLLKLEGWPVLGLIAVTGSLVVFLVQMARHSADPSKKHALRPWSLWVWAMFLLILASEGAELLLEKPGGHAG